MQADGAAPEVLQELVTCFMARGQMFSTLCNDIVAVHDDDQASSRMDAMLTLLTKSDSLAPHAATLIFFESEPVMQRRLAFLTALERFSLIMKLLRPPNNDAIWENRLQAIAAHPANYVHALRIQEGDHIHLENLFQSDKFGTTVSEDTLKYLLVRMEYEAAVTANPPRQFHPSRINWK